MDEKPKVANEFLKDFVNEAIELIKSGFVYKNHVYSFKIKAIICDAPAKAWITYTKSHNAYCSCSKCFVEGEYINNKCVFQQYQI